MGRDIDGVQTRKKVAPHEATSFPITLFFRDTCRVFTTLWYVRIYDVYIKKIRTMYIPITFSYYCTEEQGTIFFPLTFPVK